MSVSTRVAIASFDDVSAAVEMNAPDAATVLISWSRSHQSCAVMGLLDESGDELDVPADLLARLTGLIARPVSVDALRIAFPDADTTGPVLLRIPVDQAVSLIAVDNVLEQVVNGLGASDEDVRDALWLLLDAVGLPAGAVRVERIVMVPELPGDAVFRPVRFSEFADGSGAQVSWEEAAARFGDSPIGANAAAALSSELAERAERAQVLRAGAGAEPVVLTDAIVPL